MKAKIKSYFFKAQAWQITLLAMLGAMFITNTVTALFSLRVWKQIRFDLMALGTLKAINIPQVYSYIKFEL